MLNGVVHVEAFWLGWHGSTLGLPEVANFSAVTNRTCKMIVEPS
jgi:hypothetical protein